jgi:MoaA/NifB/PqqE/SkfB family radical SAM enzyme
MANRAAYLRLALSSKRGALPLYLIHHVTDHCNARCRHCFIIHDGSYAAPEGVGEGRPLTIEEISKLSSTLGPNLYTVQLTGGEPLLRADLLGIVRTYFANTPARYVQVCTNGKFTDRIAELAEAVMSEDSKRGFGFAISIDDIGSAHDANRGIQGLFDDVIATIRALERVRSVFPRLQVTINVAVSRFNQDHLMDIYDYLTGELGIRNIVNTLVRGTPSDPTACEVDAAKYQAFVERCASGWQRGEFGGFDGLLEATLVNAQNVVTRRKIIEMLADPKYRDPCYAGELSAVIYADGTVAFCETLPYVVGNLRDWNLDFGSLWQSPAAARIRRKKDETRCFCTHECFAVCNTLFNPRHWAELAAVISRRALAPRTGDSTRVQATKSSP